jgi:hypothetical protein
MTLIPDHYRYPIPGLGMERTRFSALDVAEVQMGRDRNGAYSDARARIPSEDAKRLGEREGRAVAHTIRLRAAREKLGEWLT